MGYLYTVMALGSKRNNRTKTKHIKASLGLLLSTSLLALSVLSVASVGAATVTQGYHSAATVEVGMVVSTTKTAAGDIEKTTPDNELRLAGVVVDAPDTLIDVQPHGTDVRVATQGEVSVLVSDINGAIKAGDSLIISPLAGIAMKDIASSEATRYVAVASENFDGLSKQATTVQATRQNGSHITVHVGLVKAKILLTNRTPSNKTGKNTGLLAAIAQKIAGRPVNNTQVLVSSAILLASFLLTGLILHGAVKGSFVSLGRNPLSRPAIVNNLAKVFVLALVILTGGIATAYIILAI